jgi:hypothetical protein
MIEMVVIRVVTPCATEDELVATFAKLAGKESLFIPTRTMRQVGVETGFSIRLKDGTPMLRGLCVVLGAFDSADNAFGRPGVHLGIRKLTPDSERVFARLRDPMLPLAGNDTVRLSVEEARPTVEMAPLFPDCEVTDDPTDAVPAEVTERVAADADRTIKVETERATILGMPPLVPPRKDTQKMSPVERAVIVAPPRISGPAPVAVIDEDAVPIALPFWRRVRAWLSRIWRQVAREKRVRRVTQPIGSRANLQAASPARPSR